MKWVTVDCPVCRKPNMVDPSATSELVCSHCKERTLVVSTGGVGSLTGELLGENYQVEERIGHGGFGEVYRARDRLLQRQVAVKVIAQPTDLDAARSGKFLREAVTAAQITHPNVVHVYDVGTDPKRGVHYLVMECVEGRDLKERVESEGPLPEELVTALGLQIARGLAAAHAQGIVHRDIKPGNVMETKDGGVKITDFGLAKILQVDQVTKTQTAGSVAYMPPEQFEGKVVDERADLYALGATLYYLLSGKTPYPGAHDFNVMYNILSRDPIPLPEVAPGVSEECWSLIRRLIEKDPDRRPSGAEEVIEELESLLSRSRSSVRPCASCGALNEAAAAFCVGCGKDLGPTVAAPPGPPPVAVDDDRTVVSGPVTPRKVTARRSWRGGAILVVALGGLSALAIFRGAILSRIVGKETVSPAAEEEPLAEAARRTVRSLEVHHTYRQRIEFFQVEANLLDDSDLQARAAFRMGLGSRVTSLTATELDQAAGIEDPREAEEHLATLQESLLLLEDGPLWETASRSYDAVQAAQGLCHGWQKGELREPYTAHYDRLEGLRRALEGFETRLGQIGADPDGWKNLAKRAIREGLILSPLRRFVPGEEGEERLYREVIPGLELLAEVEGRSIGEVLTEVEDAAGSRGIPIPWKRGG